MLRNDPTLYTPDELAGQLHSNPRTLERWRQTGDGPAFVKIGRRVAYRGSDVAAWLDHRVRQHTAEQETKPHPDVKRPGGRRVSRR